MSKVDPKLGQLIHQHLVSKGLETPIKPTNLSDNEKIERIQGHMASVMELLD